MLNARKRNVNCHIILIGKFPCCCIFFNLLVCCDLLKVVFREELKRRFHADFCSLAFCTYILLCIALVVLPFIIAFFSHCKCADNRMYHAHYVVALLSDSCTYVLNLRSTSERSSMDLLPLEMGRVREVLFHLFIFSQQQHQHQQHQHHKIKSHTLLQPFG